MRFLIGILTGAVITLLVATAMDAPTHPILNNARDLTTVGWDRLINATSTSLFEQSATATPAEITAEPDPGVQAPVRNEQPVPPASQTESTALEPATALPAPEPVAESPSLKAWAEAALLAEQNSHADLPVWVPFHSQMSAEGFATRLTQVLDHEFRVVRQGAGAYQVVFDATNADERAMILAQVTELTGR